jgi:uncharacterized membrane protein
LHSEGKQPQSAHLISIILREMSNYLNTFYSEPYRLKRSYKIAIISGVAVAIVISSLALFVHFRLSETEKNETGQESAEQIAKESLEALSGKESHSEGNESAEQHEKETP